jgi:hypothetical protein
MARLDGFIFKRAALDECAEAVARHDQSSSLAFGLPGWERFLAGLGLQLGGAMIDVGELFRQRNGPRKEMPESYRHSSTAVAPHAGPSVAASHPSVQGDLHDLIDRQCQIHAVYTRMIRLSLAEAAGAPGGSSPSLPTWHRSANDPLAALRGWMDDADIQRLHDGQIRSPDWRALYTAFQLLEVGMTAWSVKRADGRLGIRQGRHMPNSLARPWPRPRAASGNGVCCNFSRRTCTNTVC